MTERTLSGRTRRKSSSPGHRFRLAGSKVAKARAAERTPEAFTHLAPIAWAAGMLFASVLLAAAAVFTHKPL